MAALSQSKCSHFLLFPAEINVWRLRQKDQEPLYWVNVPNSNKQCKKPPQMKTKKYNIPQWQHYRILAMK